MNLPSRTGFGISALTNRGASNVVAAGTDSFGFKSLLLSSETWRFMLSNPARVLLHVSLTRSFSLSILAPLGTSTVATLPTSTPSMNSWNQTTPSMIGGLHRVPAACGIIVMCSSHNGKSEVLREARNIAAMNFVGAAELQRIRLRIPLVYCGKSVVSKHTLKRH